MANSEGDNLKIQSLYMKYRVQSIRDTFSILEIEYNNYTKKRLFEFIDNELFIEHKSDNSMTKNIDMKENTSSKIVDISYNQEIIEEKIQTIFYNTKNSNQSIKTAIVLLEENNMHCFGNNYMKNKITFFCSPKNITINLK